MVSEGGLLHLLQELVEGLERSPYSWLSSSPLFCPTLNSFELSVQAQKIACAAANRACKLPSGCCPMTSLIGAVEFAGVCSVQEGLLPTERCCSAGLAEPRCPSSGEDLPQGDWTISWI